MRRDIGNITPGEWKVLETLADRVGPEGVSRDTLLQVIHDVLEELDDAGVLDGVVVCSECGDLEREDWAVETDGRVLCSRCLPEDIDGEQDAE
jgi:formylmethanofuran dehydrogenase subunit E